MYTVNYFKTFKYIPTSQDCKAIKLKQHHHNFVENVPAGCLLNSRQGLFFSVQGKPLFSKLNVSNQPPKTIKYLSFTNILSICRIKVLFISALSKLNQLQVELGSHP